MPEEKFGAKHVTKSGDVYFYRPPKDGNEGGWSTDPISEDELAQYGIKKGERAGGGFGKETKLVEDYRKRNTQDELRNLGMSLVGGGVAGATSKGVGALASRLLGFGAGAATDEGIARLQGREDVNPLLDSGLDQLFDIGVGAGVRGASKVLKGEFPSFRAGISKFAANRGKLNLEESKQLESVIKLSDEFGMPAPTVMAMRGAPVGLLGQNAKTGLENQILKSQSKAVTAAIPSMEVRASNSNAEFAKKLKSDFLLRKSSFKNEERAAHEDFDRLAEANTVTVMAPQPPLVTNSTVVDQYGATVPVTIPQPDKEVTLRGPIKITKVAQWADDLNKEFTQIVSTGNLNDTSSRAINQLQGMLGNVSNAPDINGEKIADYQVVKNIRNSIAFLSKEFPAVDTRKRQMVGVAKKLVNGLSQATNESLADSSVWPVEAQLAYVKSKALTKRNAHLFNSKRARRLEGVNDTGDSVKGQDLDIDSEEEVMNALKSVNGVEALRRASGPEYDEKISSLFVKTGFDKAQNDNGLFDGNKLNDYFFKDTKNSSILNSDVVSSEQRRVIKDFTKYMQRLSSVTKEVDKTGFDYKHARVVGGALSFGIGAGSYALGGSLPLASAVGGGFATMIPVGIHFIENVLLHPEGGKLVQKLIYSPTTQQQISARQKLTEFAIKNGVKTFIRHMNQNGEEETQEVN